jgi:CRP-like cAMP-binding protein
MNKGEVFGEKSFFSGAKSEYGVKACSVVTVAYISIENFMECVKESEFLDLERFCVLRDNL